MHAFLGLAGLAFQARASTWAPELELEQLSPRQKPSEDRFADVHRELARSVAEYARPVSDEAATDGIGRMLRQDGNFVLCWRNRLYVTTALKGAAKHKPHYWLTLLLSMLARRVMPSFMVLFDSSAQGHVCEKAATTSAAGGLPCVVIAKARGYSTPGVLVPNPYFTHVEEWDWRLRGYLEAAATRPFARRDPRLFWRGAVRSVCSFGNVARLEALTLTDARPDLFDVAHSLEFDPPPNATACGERFAYSDRMRARTADDPPTGSFVNDTDFSKWQFLLNLPGTMGGSYSRNLNSLWARDAVVVLWDGPAVEWYYPALRDGESHLTVGDFDTAVTRVRDARRRPDLVDTLRRAARDVVDTFLCGACLEKYWRHLAHEVRRHFRQHAILDEPAGRDDLSPKLVRALADAVAAGLDCRALREVKLSGHLDANNATRYYDGHPSHFVPLESSDPLYRHCAHATLMLKSGRRPPRPSSR